MNFALHEWRYYHLLPGKTRLLITSFALRGLAEPFLSLFINSYIWRSTSSFFNIAAYNLGFFVFLPVGFYANGLLLKRIKITKLYLAGLIISTLSVLSVVFFSGHSFWNFLFYGFIFGFGSGMYWANRNFLSFQETISEQRNYFFSINSAVGLTLTLGVTFLTGWIIVFGEYSGLYAPTTAYWALSVFAAITLIASGIIVLRKKYDSPKINRIIQFSISKKWKTVRLLNFNRGLLEGVKFFLPTLLILLYLGEEGVLGTITAVVTLFIVMMTYLYGRLAKQKHRKPVFLISLLFYIAISLLLALIHLPLNVLIFVLLIGLADTFQWLTIDPALLDAMDSEINKGRDNQYTLIFDQEVFLNIGRIFSIMILFFLIKITSQQTGLLLAPLILGLGQLILMLPVWKKNIL